MIAPTWRELGARVWWLLFWEYRAARRLARHWNPAYRRYRKEWRKAERALERPWKLEPGKVIEVPRGRSMAEVNSLLQAEYRMQQERERLRAMDKALDDRDPYRAFLVGTEMEYRWFEGRMQRKMPPS